MNIQRFFIIGVAIGIFYSPSPSFAVPPNNPNMTPTADWCQQMAAMWANQQQQMQQMMCQQQQFMMAQWQNMMGQWPNTWWQACGLNWTAKWMWNCPGGVLPAQVPTATPVSPTRPPGTAPGSSRKSSGPGKPRK